MQIREIKQWIIGILFGLFSVLTIAMPTQLALLTQGRVGDVRPVPDTHFIISFEYKLISSLLELRHDNALYFAGGSHRIQFVGSFYFSFAACCSAWHALACGCFGSVMPSCASLRLASAAISQSRL